MIVDTEKFAFIDITTEFKFISSRLDLVALRQKKEELEAETNQPNFFADAKKVKENGKNQKNIENKLKKIKNINKLISDCEVLFEILETEDDNSLFVELKEKLESLKEEVANFKIETILNGKYDNNNAILSLHAGAGGTEAQDWTNMLFRMYSMYAEKQGFKLKILDAIDGDETGLKSISFLVEGVNAYGYLKAEKGVHRLVRISPFDANARRHTSFASLEVMPELDELPEIKVNSEDLRVDTYRASGAGGQHVNKTDSAVRITHIPTGIVVACQNERSQIQNRETAMRMLYGKLAEQQEREEMEKLNAIRGEIKKIEWGSQIRSYVFQPYTLVKDHRTNFENTNIDAVMNGEIQDFIFEYLGKIAREE
ncbi:MAG: peptide chain release factor 2 [Clostridia bacterium]|nr:peptide chain release factor 2 [Clostridia bacterium]